jgi:hypothetical protein
MAKDLIANAKDTHSNVANQRFSCSKDLIFVKPMVSYDWHMVPVSLSVPHIEIGPYENPEIKRTE